MTTKTLKVPDELDAQKLVDVIATRPVPESWPEGETYIEASQCEGIASMIVGVSS